MVEIAPPAHYPGEKGGLCGVTWQEELVVTGELPSGKGAELTHTIHPVLDQSDVQQFGYNSQFEFKKRAALSESIYFEKLKFEKPDASTYFDAGQKTAIMWLLNTADQRLAAVKQVYADWKKFGWPLYKGDSLSDFHSGCTQQPWGSSTVVKDVWGGEQVIQCPFYADYERRLLDRNRIKEMYVSAAMHLRCARYTYWHIYLQRKALMKYPAAGPFGPKFGSEPSKYVVDPDLGKGGTTTPPPTKPPPKGGGPSGGSDIPPRKPTGKPSGKTPHGGYDPSSGGYRPWSPWPEPPDEAETLDEPTEAPEEGEDGQDSVAVPEPPRPKKSLLPVVGLGAATILYFVTKKRDA